MRNYFSIGEVSKMTGLTINALRHYDKIGLCKPTYVNEETNYRYYHANQLFIFEIISLSNSVKSTLRLLTRDGVPVLNLTISIPRFFKESVK